MSTETTAKKASSVLRSGRGYLRVISQAGVAIILLLQMTDPANAQRTERRLGLNGYCPVELLDNDRLVKGHGALTQRFDDITYRFSSREARRKFSANPQRYVPALGGDCVVCYEKSHVRVAGRLEFASPHDGRIYLFPSEKWRQEFEANPQKYENVDLAVGGHSIVWLAHDGRTVVGNPEQTEVHNGFRYLFASTVDRRHFLTKKRLYEGVARRQGTVLVAQALSVSADPANTFLSPPLPMIN